MWRKSLISGIFATTLMLSSCANVHIINGMGDDDDNNNNTDNNNTNSNTNNNNVSVIETFLFQGNDGVSGLELFITDGTEAGTKLVKDINALDSSSPDQFTKFEGITYFKADDGIHGFEVWRTDGTEAGTYMLKDIAEDITSGLSELANFIVFDGKLYFTADSILGNGPGLWVTDGTSDGTQLIADVFTDFTASRKFYLPTILDNKLYFMVTGQVADLSEHTYMFVFDGESVKTVGEPLEVYRGGGMALFNGEVYFDAYDDIHGVELWKIDKDTGEPVLVADIRAGFDSSIVSELTTFGDHLYFSATETLNNKLFRLDTDGALSCIDINPTGDVGAGYLKVFNNKLYFNASNGEVSAIWVYDGINPPEIFFNTLAGDYFTVIDDKMYFTSTDEFGYALFATDGTTENTKNINSYDDILNSDSAIGSYFLEKINGKIVFDASDGVDPSLYHGREIWTSDGTQGSATMLTDINTTTLYDNQRAGNGVGSPPKDPK